MSGGTRYPRSPAPWRLDAQYFPRWRSVRAADGTRICEVAFYTQREVGDAFLVRSAPELHAALLALVRHARPCNLAELEDEDPEQHQAWRLALAALRKVDGRA